MSAPHRHRRLNTYDVDDGLDQHRKSVRDTVADYLDAVDETARLRAEYEAQSKITRELQVVRDNAFRAGRAAGMTYTDLEVASGYRRAWLERVIHNRPPQKRNRPSRAKPRVDANVPESSTPTE